MGENNIRKLIDALERASEAEDLLREVWDEIGPYHKDLSCETQAKLQKHFDFDDSE